MAGLIVLDANVLIAHFDAGDALNDRAAALLRGTGSSPFGASSITIAEVLVGPARAGRLGEAQAALGILGVREIEPGAASARLAVLRAETGLRLPDCCVLLAAEATAADAILTFDERLAAAARRRGFPVPVS